LVSAAYYGSGHVAAVQVAAGAAGEHGLIAGMEEELVANIPVGRLGEPDDVAAAVAFLCSGHASYITGEVLVLNGGWW
jgi:3-oxoacyl-[acyl-carrier protein] reductase